MRVKISPFIPEGQDHSPGDTVDVDEAEGRELTSKGWGVEVRSVSAPVEHRAITGAPVSKDSDDGEDPG